MRRVWLVGILAKGDMDEQYIYFLERRVNFFVCLKSAPGAGSVDVAVPKGLWICAFQGLKYAGNLPKHIGILVLWTEKAFFSFFCLKSAPGVGSVSADAAIPKGVWIWAFQGFSYASILQNRFEVHVLGTEKAKEKEEETRRKIL